MGDIDDDAHRVLIEVQRVLAPGPEPLEGGAPRGRPLPEEWRDDRVLVMIAMILGDPTHPGAVRALEWFYGSGLPDRQRVESRGDEVLDLGAVVLGVLHRAVAELGVERVRELFAVEGRRGDDPS